MEVEGLFRELGGLSPVTSDALRKSTELGLNPLDRVTVSPMYEVIFIDEPRNQIYVATGEKPYICC